MADVLFTSQALDATAWLLPMFAVTATAKHRVAKAKGNVCETPLPLTTPHCTERLITNYFKPTLIITPKPLKNRPQAKSVSVERKKYER